MIFFFNDTATTEIYTLSLHDALPISRSCDTGGQFPQRIQQSSGRLGRTNLAAELATSISCGDASDAYPTVLDRKSTRLNSSHANISYVVFCLIKTFMLINLPVRTLVA